MKKHSIHYLIIVFSLIFMASCQAQVTETPPPGENSQEKQASKKIKENSIHSEKFIENVDWLSDDEVLTVTEEEGEAAFYVTNVFDGGSEKIYQSPSSYVHSVVSPDKDKILIHSAPATYSAMITIIDLNGKVYYQDEVPSYELSYEWNEFNTDKLLITSFAEDWSFEVFELDLRTSQLQMVDVEQPFLKWDSDVSILYQDWNSEEISVSAPLVSKNILDGKKETIDSSSIHFERFPEYLLSVHESEGGDGEFNYQFISENGEIVSQFHMKLLSRYSDWFIPFYDMIEDKNELITFQANESGSFDTYSGTFALKKWDVMKGSEVTLIDDLPVEPIQCSPKGSYCLYGNQLEKVINLKDSAIIALVKKEG
ncbi:YqgU-like beta propeller domain-containing protein [Rossellomorea sp. NS-SX7]|uniref:YqgU-like beta propeller domain-containing protein n=1 Tax=Rossellomorea sp. NS-SX7 TaxID=3463856 RepID=UPI0040580A8C